VIIKPLFVIPRRARSERIRNPEAELHLDSGFAPIGALRDDGESRKML